MKVPKEKTSVAARNAKRRLDNPLTEAQKLKRLLQKPKGNESFSGRRIKK
jgi:hypothetical protein